MRLTAVVRRARRDAQWKTRSSPEAVAEEPLQSSRRAASLYATAKK